MSGPETTLATRADELRRAFDRSFSEPPRERIAALDDLLAIGVGTAAFALRLPEVSGLFADKKITPLPSPVAELIGIAGFRGALVPVYDLRALLGYREIEPPRWLVLAGAIALAFDRFEGQLRVPAGSIAAETTGEHSWYVREVVRTAGVARPIVHLPSVLEAITKRAAAHLATEGATSR